MPHRRFLLLPLLAFCCCSPAASPDAADGNPARDAGPLDDANTGDAAAVDVVASDVAHGDAFVGDSALADSAAVAVDAARPDNAPPDRARPDRVGTDVDQNCPAAQVGQRLGKTEFLVGGSMDDTSFAAAPFTVGYRYLAGRVPSSGPCQDCASGCYVDGASCANSAGCDWWGCWQWDQEPPGRYVANFLANTHAAGAVPMITYYVWHAVADYTEGQPEIDALQDGTRVASFLADFAFTCQVMAEDPTIPAILHVEPDLWGYGHQINSNPDLIPVDLSSANMAECSGLASTFTGFAQCLLAIANSRASNVLVAFHASAWGAGHDALSNGDGALDIAAHATATADYMRALGAADAALVVVEMSDRDAGFNNRWWDSSNATLPHFNQAIHWVEVLGQQMSVPPLWWQVPYGHMGLDNTQGRYQDNRVDYFFDHAAQFAAAGALGIAFGSGMEGMTTPATDSGNFVNRAQTFFQTATPALCQQ